MLAYFQLLACLLAFGARYYGVVSRQNARLILGVGSRPIIDAVVGEVTGLRKPIAERLCADGAMTRLQLRGMGKLDGRRERGHYSCDATGLICLLLDCYWPPIKRSKDALLE